MTLPLASLVVLVPLVGSIVVAMLADDDDLASQIATGFAAAALLVALGLAWTWDPGLGGVQATDAVAWSEAMDLSWAVGVDGLSLPLVVLTALLFLVSVLVSGDVGPRRRAYLAWLLALEVPTLGVFLARQWTLFYACWELTLVPLFLLVSAWGGKERDRAALTFLLYTMAGSVFLLVATLSLVLLGPGRVAFPASPAAAALPLGVQTALFVGFALGFGVKTPVVPLHGWLPLAHVEAPAPVSILLSGILLKMGAYGLLRTVEALPGAAAAASGVLFVLGTVGVIHGALLAWRQTDLKRIVAWSSLSHMGFVLVGLSSLDVVGLHGTMLQIVAHGLVAGLTFGVVGMVYARAHTRELGELGGLGATAPRLTVAVVLAFLASMSVPGTAGFAAELLVVGGAWTRFGAWSLLPLAGAVVWAATAVRVALSLAGGPRTHASARVTDLRPAETLALGLLGAAIVAVGLWPSLVIDLVDPGVRTLVSGLAAATGEVARVAR